MNNQLTMDFSNSKDISMVTVIRKSEVEVYPVPVIIPLQQFLSNLNPKLLKRKYN